MDSMIYSRGIFTTKRQLMVSVLKGLLSDINFDPVWKNGLLDLSTAVTDSACPGALFLLTRIQIWEIPKDEGHIYFTSAYVLGFWSTKCVCVIQAMTHSMI